MLNWEMELKRWCPSFKILTYYGAQKERKLKRQVCSPMWSLPSTVDASYTFRSCPQMNFFSFLFCYPILLLGLFSQPDCCPLKTLGCLLFVRSFHPTFCYFLLVLQGWTKPNAFHVCITSYKLVLQDHQAFRRKNWRYLILDEAQNIKNFKSQRWQSLLNFNRWRWRCPGFVGE